MQIEGRASHNGPQSGKSFLLKIGVAKPVPQVEDGKVVGSDRQHLTPRRLAKAATTFPCLAGIIASPDRTNGRNRNKNKPDT